MKRSQIITTDKIDYIHVNPNSSVMCVPGPYEPTIPWDLFNLNSDEQRLNFSSVLSRHHSRSHWSAWPDCMVTDEISCCQNQTASKHYGTGVMLCIMYNFIFHLVFVCKSLQWTQQRCQTHTVHWGQQGTKLEWHVQLDRWLKYKRCGDTCAHCWMDEYTDSHFPCTAWKKNVCHVLPNLDLIHKHCRICVRKAPFPLFPFDCCCDSL